MMPVRSSAISCTADRQADFDLPYLAKNFHAAHVLPAVADSFRRRCRNLTVGDIVMQDLAQVIMHRRHSRYILLRQQISSHHRRLSGPFGMQGHRRLPFPPSPAGHDDSRKTTLIELYAQGVGEGKSAAHEVCLSVRPHPCPQPLVTDSSSQLDRRFRRRSRHLQDRGRSDRVHGGPAAPISPGMALRRNRQPSSVVTGGLATPVTAALFVTGCFSSPAVGLWATPWPSRNGRLPVLTPSVPTG